MSARPVLGLPRARAPSGGLGDQAAAEGVEIVSVQAEPQRALGGRVQAGQVVGINLSVDETKIPSDQDPTENRDVELATGMVLNRVPVTAVDGGIDASTAGTVAEALDRAAASVQEFGQGQDVVLLLPGSGADRMALGLQGRALQAAGASAAPRTLRG